MDHTGHGRHGDPVHAPGPTRNADQADPAAAPTAERRGDVDADGELTQRALWRAWEEIYRKDLRDNLLSAGVRKFATGVDQRIAELTQSLADRSWAPQTLSPVQIPKDDGGVRELHVPPIQDRVVERAVLERLAPLIDPLLSPQCFGYREGLGVIDALFAVASLREEGLRWVVRADIDDCFPSVDRQRLNVVLRPVLTDHPRLAELVSLLMERPVRRPRGPPQVPPRGLAQGSAISPCLVNLVLVDLDGMLADAGIPHVRYADDLVLLGESREDAEDALALLRGALTRVGMRVGESEIMSFEDGFAFLGEDVGPRYPVVPASFRIEPRDTRTAYVSRPGCRVAIREGRVRVHHDDEELLSVPSTQVERLVLFGPSGLSAGARTWAMASGVEVIFCSQRGNYLGQLAAGTPRRVRRRMLQYGLLMQPEARVRIGRAIVASKLDKQAVLLRRMNRRNGAPEVANAVGLILRYQAMLPAAESLSEVMGLEGAGSRAYFEVWPAVLPTELTFGGRSRRPPRDMVNAALSLGYTLLHGEAVGALVGAGLDPEMGILHEPSDRQFALAYDLMEEFRPLIVDQVVLELCRHNRLTEHHGRTEGDGTLLTAAGRSALIDGYEKRMLRTSSGALPGFAGSYRRLMHRQAQRVAATVEGRIATWTGLSWR